MYQNKYHIGIIPDGNRRWAKINGFDTGIGHQNGSEKMELFVNWAVKNPDIDEITIYGLSEENFNRNPSELSNLYDIYYKGLSRLLKSKEIHDNKVSVNFISTNSAKVPRNIIDVCKELKSETKYYGSKMLNILIGYTGQSEILKSVSSPMNRVKNLFFGLSEQDIAKHLRVKHECDLVIRTGEEEAKREAKSGFLLWQSAYSEYYHIPKYWPEVEEKDFDQAWEHFINTKRLKGT